MGTKQDVQSQNVGISTGMQTEINRAKWKNYRLRYFTEDCQEV